MNVKQLIQSLEGHAQSAIRIALPAGEMVPAHFHVTEVGRVHKRFVDCGGTQRESVACQLQVWTADDIGHRLAAGKLAGILKMAQPLLESEELPVEIEYGPDVASQYVLTKIERTIEGLVLVLAGKQTDCLAQEKCGVAGCATSDCC